MTLQETFRHIELINEWYAKDWISLDEFTRLLNIYF